MAKSRKANKKGKALLLIVEALILCIAGVALFAVWKMTDKEEGISHYVIEEPEANSSIKEKFTTDDELSKYRNIALFGVDSRKGSLEKQTRTDTIIILSINEETGDCKLYSVYRDTFLNIGNDSYNKCNAAYAKGGYEQAINMLNMNLDLYITDFVTVGFDGLMNTIDALGGVEIDVQESEIEYLNNYQWSMYSTEEKLVLDDDYIPVTKPGLQTLNGKQAVAYCRIRYTAGDDYRRTERQRTVLEQVLVKAKKANPATLSKIAKDVMPLVATSLDIDEILAMAANVTSYNIVSTGGFPFDEYRSTGKVGSYGSCVVPYTLEDNVIRLHEELYPGIEYTPSEDVKSYSETIRSKTSQYVKAPAQPSTAE